mgnify:CR=1 FL=1|eukprot:scaffold102133_cov36-Tisochrysis_lutea.AAC.3
MAARLAAMCASALRRRGCGYTHALFVLLAASRILADTGEAHAMPERESRRASHLQLHTDSLRHNYTALSRRAAAQAELRRSELSHARDFSNSSISRLRSAIRMADMAFGAAPPKDVTQAAIASLRRVFHKGNATHVHAGKRHKYSGTSSSRSLAVESNVSPGRT